MSGFEELELRRRTACAASGKELCARCATLGQTCCQAAPEESHLFFPLSEAEWLRLGAYRHLALLPEEEAASLAENADLIRDDEPNCADFIIAMERLFSTDKKKIRELFPENGRHFRVRITKTGECVFLGSTGCRLPQTVRPWYCLLFPAWVTGKNVTWFVPENCLISRQVHSVSQLCTLLETPSETLRQMFYNLKSDWGLDGPYR